MKIAIAVGVGLLVITAMAGTAVAVGGTREAGWFIWMAGGLVSASILFLAPWVISWRSSDDPDAG